MAIHLKLVLDSEEEKKDWKSIKQLLGIKSNTEALRHLIRKAALEASQMEGVT